MSDERRMQRINEDVSVICFDQVGSYPAQSNVPHIVKDFVRRDLLDDRIIQPSFELRRHFFVCANSLNNAATCLEERSSAFSAAKVFGATRTAAEPKPTLKKFLRFI